MLGARTPRPHRPSGRPNPSAKKKKLICKENPATTDIIINLFFGPAVNAARGVAISVFSVLTNFTSNFINALNPQIVKSYASGDIDRMHQLLFNGCKYTFFLFILFALPIIMEAPFLLKLWLINPPELSVVFCQLVLVAALIDMVSSIMVYGILATGNVKCYQIIMSSLFLMVPVVSYFLYLLGMSALTYLYAEVFVYLVAIFLRPYLLGKVTGLKVTEFLFTIVKRDLLVCIISIPLPLLFIQVFDSSFYRLILTLILSISCTSLAIWFVGLGKYEKDKLLTIVRSKIYVRRQCA